MVSWWLGVMALAGTSVDAIDNPRLRNDWVSDTAQLLDAAEEAELEALLDKLHADTTAEVAVVTVADTDDEPKAFATGLFAHWGLGDADANNGLLVLLVRDRRRLEMETGYGLEGILPDGWLGAMQAERMVPHFKKDDYGTGLVQGLHAVDERLRTDVAAVREGSAGRLPTQRGEEGLPMGLWISLGMVGLGAAGAGGAGLWYRRKQRTCPTCATQMTMLNEAEDDEHLTEGQQFEESLGSMDYQVYVCATCEFTKTIPVSRWFSGFSHCYACGHKTRSSSSHTLRAATYSSGGLIEVVEQCAHCDDGRTYTRSTPRRQRSSSSSSGGGGFGGGGGGSSFGGGRSGGGGAGSSW